MANVPGSRTSFRPLRQLRNRLRPRLEPLEDRCLLANSFLQGVAYVDANQNDQFDASDPRLPGALIELFRLNEPTPVDVAMSDADGYYLFVNVPPGNYRVVETPPEGYGNQSANAFSQINPVTVPPNTRNTLLVNLLDPERLSATFQGLFAHRLIPENGVRLFGEVPVGFTGQPGQVGQFRIEVNRPGLEPVVIRSLCTTLAPPAIDWPGGPFVPFPIHGVLERGREIGYLFNRYGVRTDLTDDQGAGLQMAVWEMIYDTPSNDPWNTGNFQYVITDPQILAQANFYLNDARGHSEYASYLASEDPERQSFLATASLNFGNRLLPGMLDAWKWHDLNGDGRWDRGEPGLPGWTIQLLRGNQVVASAVTMTDDPATPDLNETGLYWLEAPAGTYTVREIPQPGWQQTYPGNNGTHTVTLRPGESFYGEFEMAVPANFGNFLPGRMSGQVTHESPDCVGMQERGAQSAVRILLERQVNGSFQLVAENVTGAGGTFAFTDLAPGTYRVRQVVQGWTELTRPPATFVVTSGLNLTGQNFRNRLPLDQNLRCGSLAGRVTFQVPVCTGVEDSGGRPGVRIFVDVNRNGRFDAGEPAAVTDARGDYRINDLGRGDHRLRLEVLNPSWTVLGPSFLDTPQETPIFTVTNLNFRLELPPEQPLRCGSLAGRVTHQVPTCEGMEDRGGRTGVTVYLDTNGNGRLDSDEPRTVTNAAGNWALAPLGAGTYRVRTVLETGFRPVGIEVRDVVQTSPTFTLTGLDFRIEVAPAIPLVCLPPRDLLPAFGGTIPAILSSMLGGKSQLLASSFIRGTQTGTTALAEPAFVTGLYRHLFNRSPDVAGLNHWTRLLETGIDRSQVVAAFWNSTEHRQIEVDFYYQTFLNRPADPAGRATWVAALQTGLAEKEMLRAFLTSAEFAARNAADDATFVAQLYVQVLGRRAEANGFGAWVQALQTGTTRQAVAVAFLESREAGRRVLDQLYRNFLDRPLDPVGEQIWLTALATRQATWGTIAGAILASNEFLQRMHNQARGASTT